MQQHIVHATKTTPSFITPFRAQTQAVASADSPCSKDKTSSADSSICNSFRLSGFSFPKASLTPSTTASYQTPTSLSQESRTNPYTMSVTLHTSHGDIKIEVFCDSVPKAAEVCFIVPQFFHHALLTLTRTSLPSVHQVTTTLLPSTASFPSS